MTTFATAQQARAFLARLRLPVALDVVQVGPLVLVGLAYPRHNSGYTILHADGRREFGGDGADLRATLADALTGTNAIVD